MTVEELRVLEQEMRQRGTEARLAEHPMFVAGVLLGVYARSTLMIDRMALSYVFSLLLESVTLPGAQE
jgi:hypothetical protein